MGCYSLLWEWNLTLATTPARAKVAIPYYGNAIHLQHDRRYINNTVAIPYYGNCVHRRHGGREPEGWGCYSLLWEFIIAAEAAAIIARAVAIPYYGNFVKRGDKSMMVSLLLLFPIMGIPSSQSSLPLASTMLLLFPIMGIPAPFSKFTRSSRASCYSLLWEFLFNQRKNQLLCREGCYSLLWEFYLSC